MVSTCMQTPLVLVGGGCGKIRRASRYLPSRVIKGHQGSSRVTRCDQWQSLSSVAIIVIKGDQV